MSRNLENLIDKKNIIFVDCFDTLVYRKCSPNTVLKRWFYLIGEKYAIDVSVVEEIWNLSTKTNRQIREELFFETVAYNIFSRIQYVQKELNNFDEFYVFLLESYIKIELDVLVLNNELCSILKNAKIKGKRIYLVSDFYMPQKFFERVFQKLNIREVFDGMYISSDVGYRKSSGSMYEWLLKEMDLNIHDILMIGDNEISDYQRPQEKGISAYKIKVMNLKCEETINHKLMEIFEKQYKENPLSNYSFSLYLFMRELLNYVKENKVEDLYFCSREGEFFKEIFDMLIRQNEISIRTHYLLVSRKSTFLPSLNRDIRKEKFMTLKKSADRLSLSEFITTLGLQLEDYSLYKQTDMKKRISNFWESEEFELLKSDSMFLKKYEKAVISEKKEFEQYLESIGIRRDNKNVNIVDIGWKGTIQDNLYNYFEGDMEINGLYYGIEGDVVISSHNRKYGLVYFDVPVRSRYFSIYSTNHRMLERLLQASHGTADCYREGDCILAEYGEKEKKLYDLMKENKQCIRETIMTLNKIFNEVTLSTIQIKEFIAYLHETYLMCYTRKLYLEECNFSNLMLMTFGTEKKNTGYSDILKTVLKMSKVEKINKFFKVVRRLHCNFISDVLVSLIYHFRKKRFLQMEI